MLPVLFGLGAISAAKYPDGVLAEQSRRLRRLCCVWRRTAEDDAARRRPSERAASSESARRGRPRGSRSVS